MCSLVNSLWPIMCCLVSHVLPGQACAAWSTHSATLFATWQTSDLATLLLPGQQVACERRDLNNSRVKESSDWRTSVSRFLFCVKPCRC